MWPCLGRTLCVALKYRDTLACLLSAETTPAIGNCLHTHTHTKNVKYYLKFLIFMYGLRQRLIVEGKRRSLYKLLYCFRLLVPFLFEELDQK